MAVATYCYEGNTSQKFNYDSMKSMDDPNDSSEFRMNWTPKPGNHPTQNDNPMDKPKIKHVAYVVSAC